MSGAQTLTVSQLAGAGDHGAVDCTMCAILRDQRHSPSTVLKHTVLTEDAGPVKNYMQRRVYYHSSGFKTHTHTQVLTYQSADCMRFCHCQSRFCHPTEDQKLFESKAAHLRII